MKTDQSFKWNAESFIRTHATTVELSQENVCVCVCVCVCICSYMRVHVSVCLCVSPERHLFITKLYLFHVHWGKKPTTDICKGFDRDGSQGLRLRE